MSLIEVLRDTPSEKIYQQLAQEIYEAMVPFHTGDIWVSVDFQTELFDAQRLRIDIQTLPGHPFYVHIDGIDSIASQFRRQFNKLYVQPDDHIQLGLE